MPAYRAKAVGGSNSPRWDGIKFSDDKNKSTSASNGLAQREGSNRRETFWMPSIKKEKLRKTKLNFSLADRETWGRRDRVVLFLRGFRWKLIRIANRIFYRFVLKRCLKNIFSV